MKTNKQPIEKGVAKVPVIIQLEALECGAACLTMILAYYNKWIPLEQVRKDCGVSRNGSNAKNILLAARSYNLEAKGYSYELQSIKTDCLYPCIIHWGFNHFVVLNGFKNNYAYINDPARGEVKLSMDEFDKNFTGIVIIFKPTDKFVPDGKRRSVLKFAFERMKGAKTALIFAILTSIISYLMGAISPGFSRVFYDRLLTGQNRNWTFGFILGFCMYITVQIIVSLIQVIYSNRVSGKLSAQGSTSYFWKVLTLPMEFFSQRMASDIQSRQYTNATIANSLVNTYAPLVLQACMMIFYLIVMIRNSLILTIVGLTSMVINVFISTIISKKRINLSKVSTLDNAKLASCSTAGIEMIETIKSSGAENGYYQRWAGYQANVLNAQVKIEKDTRYLNLLMPIVSQICSLTITGIGVYMTMRGNFTIGAISAFEGYLSSFNAPTTSLISAATSLQEMRTDMERIDDVMKYPNDVVYTDIQSDNYSKLTGNIELKNITFGYSPLDKPLIENLNIEIKAGQKIAFVGSSGCGKSTIAKLISGLHQPLSGEILYDGKKITEIDRNVFTGSLAVVDQDVIMFEDTISNNIKMWDNSIEDFEMILAARDAQIHDDIIARANGYKHVLNEGGKDFSGGQRQRLEIARVLAQDPTICILDEATSALDAKTEYDVVKAISDRHITTIVIAHRLSTIRDCDQIYVLDHGKIVEQGTHKELMKLNGFYTQLITSD